MGKFENVAKIIVIVAGLLTVIDIMGIIHNIKKRIKAGTIKASADAYKTALDAEIALANFTWSATIEKIRLYVTRILLINGMPTWIRLLCSIMPGLL